jgi:hypothetical protein
MNAQTLAVQFFLQRGVPADQAEPMAQEMTDFLRTLVRETTRQQLETQKEGGGVPPALSPPHLTAL